MEANEIDLYDRFSCDENYSTEFVEEHIEALFKNWSIEYNTPNEEFVDDFDDIYERYDFSTVPKHRLPICEYRNEILNALKSNTVVVIEGATGCGKTTQVPQFIIDDCRENGRRCNVIVTQPRRIAAVTNAERISAERKWPPRSIVGYQIGMDERSNYSDDTRLLFCTTGILLEKLIVAKDFLNFTHIIIDEVHERSNLLDLLLIVIKKIFAIAPPSNIKVILMSATIDAQTFAKYFELPSGDEMMECPIIKVNQSNEFKIQEIFYDELKLMTKIATNVQFIHDRPRTNKDLFPIVIQLLRRFDKYDDDEFNGNHKEFRRPTVLIFLPGIYEILDLKKAIETTWPQMNSLTALQCIVLHSTSDAEEIRLAMRPSKLQRKIILATNIAESSITVPDVKYVIDFCLERTLICDQRTNFVSLNLKWISRSNCRQRAGRTGRVMNGRCYRLIPRQFYLRQLDENALPEMKISPLDDVILKIKCFDLDSPKAILALAVDPPELDGIQRSVLRLRESGVMTDSNDDGCDGIVTAMGRVIGSLPLSISASKIIVLGYCFGVLDECIVIACALSCNKSFFKSAQKPDEELMRYKNLLRWSAGSNSDLIAMFNAYNSWLAMNDQGEFGGEEGSKKEQKWAAEKSLDLRALTECKLIVADVKRRLEMSGIKSNSSLGWSNSERNVLLSVVTAGAFYPNYFRLNYPVTFFEADNFEPKEPRNSVYFTGFSPQWQRQLYAKRIKETFVQYKILDAKKADKIEIEFPSNSTKVFVSFDHGEDRGLNNQMTSRVSEEVYKAIKLRSLEMPFKIPILGNKELEMSYYNALDLTQDGQNDWIVPPPEICEDRVVGYVSHIETCDRFWFQSIQQSNEVKFLSDYLKRNRNSFIKPFSNFDEISRGNLVIVELEQQLADRPIFYRAKVQEKTKSSVELFLIDTGNVLKLTHKPMAGLRDPKAIPRKYIEMPAQCFVCRLAGIKPTSLHYMNGIWSPIAIEYFQKFVENRVTEVEIVSVSNRIANVSLHSVDTLKCLNDSLVDKYLADLVELPTKNRIQETEHSNLLLDDSGNETNAPSFELTNNDIVIDCDPPPSELCQKTILLSGPRSSLERSPSHVVEGSRGLPTCIDRSSINSVLLDRNHEQCTDKYLFAYSIALVENGKRISARHTGLMPDIEGIGPLITLIFGPRVKIARDIAHTKYVAIRAGIEASNDETNDVVMPLDVELTPDDLELVNRIRRCLNAIISNDLSRLDCDADEFPLKLHELLFKLLDKPRNKQFTAPGNQMRFDWSETSGEYSMKDNDIANDVSDMLAPHFIPTLN